MTTDLAAGHDSRALANEIIKLARERGRTLTIMQLLKLAYFAHGWSLGLRDIGLSKHVVQAWQYGPVFPHIYRSLSGSGSRPIESLIIEKATGLPYTSSFSQDDRSIIEQVVDGYSAAHAFVLSDLTHEAGTPWDVVFKTSGPYSEIPNLLIRDHFKKLAGARQTA